jgi:hypothetical protein
VRRLQATGGGTGTGFVLGRRGRGRERLTVRRLRTGSLSRARFSIAVPEARSRKRTRTRSRTRNALSAAGTRSLWAGARAPSPRKGSPPRAAAVVIFEGAAAVDLTPRGGGVKRFDGVAAAFIAFGIALGSEAFAQTSGADRSGFEPGPEADVPRRESAHPFEVTGFATCTCPDGTLGAVRAGATQPPGVRPSASCACVGWELAAPTSPGSARGSPGPARGPGSSPPPPR